MFSRKSVIRIIYYMMSADGRISESEQKKFDEIGGQVDEQFSNYRDELIEECDKKIAPFTNDAVSRFRLQQAIADELKDNEINEEGIGARSLMWNILVLSHSDGNYAEEEKELVRIIATLLKIDDAVILEMNSAIDAVDALDRELIVLQQSHRPYAQISVMIEENEKRKNSILEGVRDLIGDETYLMYSADKKTVTRSVQDSVAKSADKALDVFSHTSGSIKKKFNIGFGKKKPGKQ